MDETPSSASYTADMVPNIATSHSYSSRAENDFLDHNGRYVIRWKSGEKVDQRLLRVLEIFFNELYLKRREFFQKIFPELQGQFTEVFKKVGTVLLKNNKNQKWKYQTMQRCLSLGSPRTSNRSQDQDLSELRVEKFKVRLVASDDDEGRTSRTGGGDDQWRIPKSRPKLQTRILRSQTAGFDGERSEQKPTRFKVRTPRVIIAKPDEGQDQTGTSGTSSSTSSTATNSN